MNSGNDPRGLDFSFRQSTLNIIKTILKDYYAPSSDDLTCLRSLDEIANKFEHKVFVEATSRDGYVNIIEQKLTQTANMLRASSVAGNQLEKNVIPMNTNILAMQPRNNHDFSQQNSPDCRLTGDETSSAYVDHSQNYSGASALSSISDSGNTNTDLIARFRSAKLSYLPELEKWLTTMELEGKFFQDQTVSEHDNLQKHIVSVRQMIILLNVAENQLLVFDKQKLCHNLNIVIEYYDRFVKNGNISFAMNQAYQLSSPRRMACRNVTQKVPTGPVLMKQPVISSLTMNPGFSKGYVISTEPTDMKSNTMTNLVTQIQSPETRQPEKRKVSSNATSRTSKKPSSKTTKISSGNSHEAWLNLAISRSSKRSSIPTKLSQSSTPKTPMTPSCGIAVLKR